MASETALYTHRYKMSEKVDTKKFKLILADFKKIIKPLSHLGVGVAGSHGNGKPEIGPDRIRFNGVAECGHPKINMGIVQPSSSAAGVLIYHEEEDLLNIAHKGRQGVILEKRACNGDCSNETFSLVRDITKSGVPSQIRDGKYLELVRTSYKPYDLAVNACLIIADHHLKDEIHVGSDGDIERWKDAMQLCEHFLEYGKDFELEM